VVVGAGAGLEARTWTGGEPGVSGMTRFDEPASLERMGVVGAELGTTDDDASSPSAGTGPASFWSPGTPGLR
jgi:hypothetical protein